MSNTNRVDVVPARPGADEIEPADYVWALWRRKFLILGVTVLCGTGAFAAAAVSAPVYQATAVIVAASAAPEGLPYAAIVQIRNLLQNAAVVERALAVHRDAAGGLTPATFISRNLTVEHNRDTDFFSVTVRLASGEAAARVANSLADEAVASYGRLSAAEDSAAPSPSGGQNVAEAGRARVEHLADQLVRFRTESRFDDRSNARAAATAMKEQLSLIAPQLAGARASLQVLQREAAQQDEPVRLRLAAQVSDLRSRIAGLEEQQRSLAAAYDAGLRDVAEFARIEVQLAALNAAYQSVAEQHAAPPPIQAWPVELSVTERATPPTAPIAPRPVRSLLLGLTLGLFMSVLGALLLDAVASSASRGPELARASG
jgi:uncharacterized protein involved in exopolysaccharide biosynthesis